MYKISSKVFTRISSGIKNLQPILKSASSRDVNENDTVTIIVDILSGVLGYDKFLEVTKEFQIRSTYCDLATLINGEVNLLIEVKAIGIELKDIHTKQAIDYASNKGVDWVILTNGINWRVYKVYFTKPIAQKLVYDFNFLELSSKRKKDIELLYPLTKEGAIKSSLKLYHDQRQTLSRFYLGALLTTDKYLTSIQRDLRKLSPGIKIELDEIEEVLKNELFKREVIESEEIKTAARKINRLLEKKQKSKPKNDNVQKESSTNLII
jgi:hypothetical protein